MTSMKRGGTDYIGYEYKDKVVPAALTSLYLDSYPCFGWEEDPNSPQRDRMPWGTGHVALRFRRDRKICNKTELTRLQRHFDGCVGEIEALERSQHIGATMWALIVGMIGTAFMAGSVFAVTAQPPQILLCILLAVPAFVGWTVPIFLYRALIRRKTVKTAPLIEEKYDELYELCEKGNRLLL